MPVDRLNPGIFQMAEHAGIPICTLYVDYSTPKSTAISDKLIKTVTELKPHFEDELKFVWTDSKDALSKRSILGVTWDELPAIAINSLQNIDFAYPRGELMTKTNLMRWLKEVTSG